MTLAFESNGLRLEFPPGDWSSASMVAGLTLESPLQPSESGDTERGNTRLGVDVSRHEHTSQDGKQNRQHPRHDGEGETACTGSTPEQNSHKRRHGPDDRVFMPPLIHRQMYRPDGLTPIIPQGRGCLRKKSKASLKRAASSMVASQTIKVAVRQLVVRINGEGVVAQSGAPTVRPSPDWRWLVCASDDLAGPRCHEGHEAELSKKVAALGLLRVFVVVLGDASSVSDRRLCRPRLLQRPHLRGRRPSADRVLPRAVPAAGSTRPLA